MASLEYFQQKKLKLPGTEMPPSLPLRKCLQSPCPPKHPDANMPPTPSSPLQNASNSLVPVTKCLLLYPHPPVVKCLHFPCPPLSQMSMVADANTGALVPVAVALRITVPRLTPVSQDGGGGALPSPAPSFSEPLSTPPSEALRRYQ